MSQRDIGAPVPDFTPPERPGDAALEGRYARLERLDAARHAEDLHRAFRADDAIWHYMYEGPYDSAEAYADRLRDVEQGADQIFYAIQDLERGHFAGVASYLRIAPEAGSIEVGNITLSPELQQTRAATEAMALMMRWAFEAEYRRYEWKCNALNLPSRRAAQRLGFSFEGVFRQAAVVKGRNRDTAWFAVIDAEWPALKAAYDTWLDPANFDAAGRQRRRLSDFTAPVRVASDPALGD